MKINTDFACPVIGGQQTLCVAVYIFMIVKRTFLLAAILTTVSLSVLFYRQISKSLTVSYKQSAKSTNIPHPLHQVVYYVREDTLAELKQVTKSWQRWAEYPPCRHNTKPTNWEVGQVQLNLFIHSTNTEAPIKDKLKEAWDNLPNRVKWCFADPSLVITSNNEDAIIESQKGSFLFANANLWPIRDNWLNALALQSILDNQKFDAFGILDDQAEQSIIIKQAVYYNQQSRSERNVSIASHMFAKINGSTIEFQRRHPHIYFVIADHGANADDF